jgi:DNA-directed RNA polymerase alpha subunit
MTRKWWQEHHHLLKYLPDRERRIIELRYPLSGRSQTRDEVASSFGISGERVRQIQNQTEAKIELLAQAQDQALKFMAQGKTFNIDELKVRLRDLQRRLELPTHYVTRYEIHPDIALKESPISDLELSLRVSNSLQRSGVVTIGDLLKHSESTIRKIQGIGNDAVDEIVRKLLEHGAALQPD